MFKNPQPITKEADLHLKVLPSNDFSFSAEQPSLLIGLSEIIACSREVPVLFTELETGLATIALLGNQEEGNKTLSNGVPLYEYIPAALRAYPFLLMRDTNNKDNLIIALERDTMRLSEDEGLPLFTEEGEAGPLLENVKQMLEATHVDQQRAATFAKIVQEAGLLQPFGVTATTGGNKKTINFEGLFFIDEKKLNALPDEKFLEFKEKGLLPSIYAHLISLGRVNRMLPAEKTE